MHIYTLREVCTIVVKLMNEGMGLEKAVNLASGTYGFNSDDVYIYMHKHNMGN